MTHISHIKTSSVAVAPHAPVSICVPRAECVTLTISPHQNFHLIERRLHNAHCTARMNNNVVTFRHVIFVTSLKTACPQ